MRRPAVAALALLLLTAPAGGAGPPPELWFYDSVNLLPDANVDAVETLWRRAAAAGYTHVLLTDSKFARFDLLGDGTPPYRAHVGRLQRLARELQLTVVPTVFPVGYSSDLLAHDPNLAEGLPVRDVPFVVRDGVATPAPDPAATFANVAFKDDAVRLDGRTATVGDHAGNARLAYRLTVPPFHAYHVSVDVRTQGVTPLPRVSVLGDGQELQASDTPVRPTQDWTPVDVVFDTLGHSAVTVYFGVWGGGRGTLQWRNWQVEPAGPVNVLRRPGTPCVVGSYVEGRDYEPVRDPRLGVDPYAGGYTPWHRPPKITFRRPPPDGTRVDVSWYYPPVFTGGQVMACVSDPAVGRLLAADARQVRDLWAAPGYMMDVDEVRCLDWDPSCQGRHLDAGPVLAGSLRDCTALLAGSTPYVWSDMVDPTHNAHADYYLVRGDLTRATDGLSKQTVVVNWNYDHRDASLAFFAARGNRQVIAGYYDGDVDQVHQWLASADKVQGVVGVMYTTWANRYDDLERFAQLCRPR